MIEKATSSDLNHLILLAKEHHKKILPNWAFDPVRLSMTISGAINAPDWLCLTDHQRCWLLASYFENPLGAGRFATEHFICADNSRQFADLLNAYETWARKNGCILVSLSCTRKFDAFSRLYRRFGYEPAEMTTCKVL